MIVTGGAGALGQAVVTALRATGADVAVLDRGFGHAPAGWAADAGITQIPIDLLDDAAVQRSVRELVTAQSRIDGLVCLAGGFFGDTPIVDTATDRLREQLDLNLVSAYAAVHAVLPHMLAAGGGAIVCVGSRPAVRAVPNAVAYAIAKLGVVKLMEAVAEEYRGSGIRANAILPSIIDTPANRRAMPDADAETWVRPEQIAAVVRFLVSADAEVISGAAIPVYGRA